MNARSSRAPTAALWERGRSPPRPPILRHVSRLCHRGFPLFLPGAPFPSRIGFNGGMRLAAGVLLLIAGGIWILQGLDIAFAPKSFMTGNPWWVLWGAVAVALGAALLRKGRSV